MSNTGVDVELEIRIDDTLRLMRVTIPVPEDINLSIGHMDPQSSLTFIIPLGDNLDADVTMTYREIMLLMRLLNAGTPMRMSLMDGTKIASRLQFPIIQDPIIQSSNEITFILPLHEHHRITVKEEDFFNFLKIVS